MPNYHPRRAFAISGLVILLALIVFGLYFWKAAIRWPHIPANHPRATGYKFGMLMPPFVWAAVAAIAGYAAYRIARRSEAAANAVAGVVLLIPATLLSIGAASYLMHKPQATPAQRPSTADPSNRLADSMRTRPPAPSAAAPTSPLRPPVTQPRSAPLSQAPAGPPPVAAPPRPPEAENPAVVRTLADLTKEIDSEVGGLLIQAEAVFTALAKPPRQDRRLIDERVKQLAAFRDASEPLARRLRGLTEEATKRLRDAGVSDHEAISGGIRYALAESAMMRAMACDAYVRLCEAGTEEAEFLRENFGKWTLNAKGEVTSKDVMIEGRARGPRMRIEMVLGDKERLDRTLRGQ